MYYFKSFKLSSHFITQKLCLSIQLFLSLCLVLPGPAWAQSIATFSNVSVPSVNSSGSQVLLKGLNLNPQNPLTFDFILDTVHDSLGEEIIQEESNKLIKYFLTALTVPEEDLWVNLNPKEANRIIPKEFGLTAMGRDLLVQDYQLKQIMSQALSPKEDIGKKFWEKLYAKIQSEQHIELPENFLSKVWIVPQSTSIYEHANGAFVVNAKLGLRMEEQASLNQRSATQPDVLMDQMIQEVILPAVEKEVNEGVAFANLRQIYHSMILATWYKQVLKEGILKSHYINQSNVEGVRLEDNYSVEQVFQTYVDSIKQGLHQQVHEHYDPLQQEMIPRKFFTGGVDAAKLKEKINEGISQGIDKGQVIKSLPRSAHQISWSIGENNVDLTVMENTKTTDLAQTSREKLEQLSSNNKFFNKIESILEKGKQGEPMGRYLQDIMTDIVTRRSLFIEKKVEEKLEKDPIFRMNWVNKGVARYTEFLDIFVSMNLNVDIMHIYREDGRLKGYILAEPNFNRVSEKFSLTELSFIGVDLDHPNHSQIAQALLLRLMDDLIWTKKNYPAKKVVINLNVRNDNSQAKKFYEKYGFQKIINLSKEEASSQYGLTKHDLGVAKKDHTKRDLVYYVATADDVLKAMQELDRSKASLEKLIDEEKDGSLMALKKKGIKVVYLNDKNLRLLKKIKGQNGLDYQLYKLNGKTMIRKYDVNLISNYNEYRMESIIRTLFFSFVLSELNIKTKMPQVMLLIDKSGEQFSILESFVGEEVNSNNYWYAEELRDFLESYLYYRSPFNSKEYELFIDEFGKDFVFFDLIRIFMLDVDSNNLENLRLVSNTTSRTGKTIIPIDYGGSFDLIERDYQDSIKSYLESIALFFREKETQLLQEIKRLNLRKINQQFYMKTTRLLNEKNRKKVTSILKKLAPELQNGLKQRVDIFTSLYSHVKNNDNIQMALSETKSRPLGGIRMTGTDDVLERLGDERFVYDVQENLNLQANVPFAIDHQVLSITPLTTLQIQAMIGL